MRVAIFGGGNMGSAFARGCLDRGGVSPDDLTIIESDEQKRSHLTATLRCLATAEVSTDVANADIILLAVKPQDFASSAVSLRAELVPGQIIVSIMAGVTLETISELLGVKASIVRAMPNLPAQIGKGVTVYIPGAHVSSEQIQIADNFLGNVGTALQVSGEGLLDAATAIAGSGPAYLFYIVEQMLASAFSLGFSESDAEALVCGTFEGALELLKNSEHSATELRQLVSSKGGTTEAALSVFQQKEVGEGIKSGVRAAFDRSRELGE